MERLKIGLTNKEVEENRKKYGSNAITAKKQEGFFHLLLESLGDPIIKILLIALAIKTVFLLKDFDWFETIGIVIAIFLASFISTVSEYGSEKAFKRLQEETSKIKCRVLRNGKIVEVSIDEIVVEDIVLLDSGDKIPADGMIVEGELNVDESSLNGETKEQHKETWRGGTITEKNSVFRGTVVYSGRAKMKVTKVGDQTFYGKLSKELQEKQPESPLRLRLRGLANVISKIGYVGAVLVSLSYLFYSVVIINHFDLELIMETLTNFPLMLGYILYALTLSVTIIVVAVPEGLPMMITLVLSSNMKRMLKDHVLVRKLMGIETAGSINILFTDKTGTLTKGKLEVVSVMGGDKESFKKEKELEKYPRFHELVKLSMLYNNGSTFNEQRHAIGGNITDRAILEFIKSDPKMNYQIKNNLPFDSKNKYSKTTVDGPKKLTLIKGAPEKILPFCTEYYRKDGTKASLIGKREIERLIKQATMKGIRVLVLATSERDTTYFRNLTLVGIVYIKDDVRKEAKEGVKLVESAHIQTVMITGDNKDTASAIAKEVGLLNIPDALILTSDEMNQKNDEEMKQLLPRLRVVARSLPQDKSRLIRLSQECDLVVGMTGDGVNDAPALKKADVGFAMGSGTEVAKEASDVVILDDNFLSISKAILFGRTIFKSIRKFIILQLTINCCAIGLSIIGPFIGIGAPVTVIQMLWINMVMDTLAGLAFAFEPPLKEYMKEKPKKKEEPIMNKYMMHEIIFTGAYSCLLCILFLKLPIMKTFYRSSPNDEYLMTAFFALFIFIDIFNSLNARTHRLHIFANIFKNKVFILVMIFIISVQILLVYYGGSLFRTSGLTLRELLFTILLAATVIPVDWLRKITLRLQGVKGGV